MSWHNSITMHQNPTLILDLLQSKEYPLFWQKRRQHAFVFYVRKKPKGQYLIKNEQSRETGNIGYARHKSKRNKTTTTTQYVLDTTIRKQTQIT
jgi:hypothetical protein